MALVVDIARYDMLGIDDSSFQMAVLLVVGHLA